MVVVLASTVVFLRVLGEVAVVAPEILPATGPPLAAMMAWMLVLSGGLYLAERGRLDRGPRDRSPPSELGAAIAFGVLYALVLLGMAVAREHLGEGGLYLMAGLSGLTDMDAITLSTAQLARAGELAEGTAWRVILVGAMANLVFKGGVVAVLGGRGLTRRVGLLFALALAGGGAVLSLWP